MSLYFTREAHQISPPTSRVGMSRNDALELLPFRTWVNTPKFRLKRQLERIIGHS